MERAVAAIALALASSACVPTRDGAPGVAQTGGEQPNASTQLAHVEADYQACRAAVLATGAAKDGANGPGTASFMHAPGRRAAPEASGVEWDLSFQQAYDHGVLSAHGREAAQAAMRRCMLGRGYTLKDGSPA